MLFVTGDCHMDYSRFSSNNFPDQKELSKDDYVLICGDFGLWEKSLRQQYELMKLNRRNFTTLFVDGNHENFDLLESFPVKDWHGGRVHEILPGILHLMRGEIYDICGKKCFVFGGANSHDIQDGILENDENLTENIKNLISKDKRLYRINHVSWWAREMPSASEMKYAQENLSKYDWKVDYIFSHEGPASAVKELKGTDAGYDALRVYLEFLKQKISYSEWYFGHHHVNADLSDHTHVLYKDIVKLF